MVINALVKNTVVVFVACGLVVALSALRANAQTPIGNYFVVRMLQGQESRISSDFVGTYNEGREFRLSLIPMGYNQGGSGYPSNMESLTAMLIDADGTTTEQRLDASGTVKFKDVGAGMKALLVTAGGAAYSAIALYLEPSLDNILKSAPDDPSVAPPVNSPVDNGVVGGGASGYALTVGQVDQLQIGKQVGMSGVGCPVSIGRGLRPLTDYTLTVASRFRVALMPDGTLVGRVIVPEQGFEQMTGPVQLSFYRNGMLVAHTVSSAEGTFYVSGLGLGPYTVVAYGPSGHAAFAFDIISAAKQSPAISKKLFSGSLPVSTEFVTQAPNELVVLLIPPTLMPAVRQVVARAYGVPSGEGMGGFAGPGGGFGPSGFSGGAGGGAGGGASGGGGLGGLGGLLGIGGLAAVVVALGSRDDGFDTSTASLISP